MWGNAPGWAISAVMVLATAGLLYYLSLPPEVSRPSGLIPMAYNAIELPAVPAGVASPGTNDCDAGEAYRKAINACLENPKSYQDAVHAGPSELPGVRLLLDARGCSRMRLFVDTPRELINYNNEQPQLEALVKLGDAANSVGLGLTLDKNPGAARLYFEAAFELGRHLADERICWRELASGLSLMSESGQNLAKIADQSNNRAQADAMRRFTDATLQYQQKLQEQVASPLANPVEQTYGGQYTGDVYAVAQSPAADRVWRVEAILHIGRYRYNVADGHRGDQLAAEPHLRHLDSTVGVDAVLHAAIRAAQNLTLDQQQMTR